MKTKKILSALMLILFALFVVQCEKGGNHPDRADAEDEDSDRPAWAGKDGTGDNPHPSTNPSPGISKGGDYGDLYELLRTVDGVPILTSKTVDDETTWYVQPVASDGITPLPLNDEGELLDPTQATAVEFGRLNIVRSPPSVLEQAFNESMKVLIGEGEGVPATREVLDITLDFCGRLTAHYTDDGEATIVVKTIDSPRENMAIYKEIMQNQEFNHAFTGRLEFLNGIGDPLEIAASCFAAGSDKTGTVNDDEMIFINTFMECVGDDPLINDNEFGPDGLEREYFDFTSYNFTYDRSVYGNRYIQYLVDENGLYHEPDPVTGISTSTAIYKIRDVFEAWELPAYSQGSFTHRWDQVDELVGAELFALAIDDAVQVLEYVHEDSNIRFVDEFGNPL